MTKLEFICSMSANVLTCASKSSGSVCMCICEIDNKIL